MFREANRARIDAMKRQHEDEQQGRGSNDYEVIAELVRRIEDVEKLQADLGKRSEVLYDVIEAAEVAILAGKKEVDISSESQKRKRTASSYARDNGRSRTKRYTTPENQLGPSSPESSSDESNEGPPPLTFDGITPIDTEEEANVVQNAVEKSTSPSDPDVDEEAMEDTALNGVGSMSDANSRDSLPISTSERIRNIIEDVLPPFSSFIAHVNVFIYNMQPRLPIISRHITSEFEVYQSNKLLSLAIVALTSGAISPVEEPARLMASINALGECVVLGGWTSLELIDCLLLMAAWAWPKAKGQALSHQNLYMAATMAMDLDTDRKSGRLADIPPARRVGSVDRMRAFLSCYLLCSDAAMGSCRPCLIKATPRLAQYMAALGSRKGLYALDQTFLNLVEVHIAADRVLDEVAPDGSMSLDADEWEQLYKDFKDVMIESDIALENPFETLFKLHYHTINWYVHEAYRDNFPVHKWKGSFSARGSLPQDFGLVLESIEGILEGFLTMDHVNVRSLPVSAFVKVARAGVTLLRMCFLEIKSAGSRHATIKALLNRRYLHRIKSLLCLAVGREGRSRAAKGFADLFSLLTQWDNDQWKSEPVVATFQFEQLISEHRSLGDEKGALTFEVMKMFFKDEQSGFMRDDVFFDAVEKLETGAEANRPVMRKRL
ncbi:MAG: hypothetical protein Q9217_003608 [Psora testacea]